MQMRCYRCGWSFALPKDEITFALRALQESGGNHYDAHCPRCKHANPISMEQLRRAAPRSPAPEKPPTPEDESPE